jgi:hypothetical protein
MDIDAIENTTRQSRDEEQHEESKTETMFLLE